MHGSSSVEGMSLPSGATVQRKGTTHPTTRAHMPVGNQTHTRNWPRGGGPLGKGTASVEGARV
jgi:hypothetical protein